jgi:hypothetical protein
MMASRSRVIIVLVAVIGISLTTQGWKSRIPFYDLTPPIDDASELLTHGKIPEWGRVNSLGSYSAPGSAWLLVPGVAWFSDPRLFEYAGAGSFILEPSSGSFYSHNYSSVYGAVYLRHCTAFSCAS